MHILFVSSWYPYSQQDVSASFVREQAEALVKTGRHQIGVLFPYFMPGDTEAGTQGGCCAISHARENGIATYRMPLPRVLNRIPLVSAHVWRMAGHRLFKRYVATHGHPDVIYAHTMFYAGVFAARINQKYAVPYVILEHDSGYARGFVKPWQLTLGKKAAASARANLAVGQRFSELLERVYGMETGSWRCLPNMVADGFFHTPLPPAPANSPFVYCTVCNLNRNKGIDILVRAFAEIFKQQPDSKLIIGGDGVEKTALQQLAAEEGVGQAVEFRGKVSRSAVVRLLSETHVFVSASYYETFGIAIAEALALGRPVIATDSGGPADIVRPDNGLLIPAGDADVMSGAMLRLRDSYVDYDPAIIRSGCESRFSEQVFVNHIEKILRGD